MKAYSEILGRVFVSETVAKLNHADIQREKLVIINIDVNATVSTCAYQRSKAKATANKIFR